MLSTKYQQFENHFLKMRITEQNILFNPLNNCMLFYGFWFVALLGINIINYLYEFEILHQNLFKPAKL